MTSKLAESIIFLNNLLIDKEDHVVEVIENVNIPLREACIEIAKKLKDYDRPIKEQLLGLFCLCYRHELLKPRKIDVSEIEKFIGEDMADDIEVFSLFALDEGGVRSLGAAQNVEEKDKDFMWWLFLAINDVIFRNPYVDGFLRYVLKFPNAPKSLKDTEAYKQQFIQATLEQEHTENVRVVQQFEDMIEKIQK